MTKKKKILVAECNVSGEWWCFEKLDSLIDHFHWYYKDPVLCDDEGRKPSRKQVVSILKTNNEIELHSKKPHSEHNERYLFVRMTRLN
jgi:hypothetical protein